MLRQAHEGAQRYNEECRLSERNTASDPPSHLLQQAHEIFREWRLETKLTMIGGMMKRQMTSVQCLPREVDGSNGFGSVNVPLLSYERMTAQAGLDANLVAFSRVQTDLDE